MQRMCHSSPRVYANQVALSLVALLSTGSSCSAAEVSALVRLTSNYEYRGYTLSDNHAAAQANVDVAWPTGYFFGSWISSADFGDANLAVNPYVGKSFILSPDWQVVTSVSGHLFNDDISYYNASYGEGALRLDYRDLGSLQFSYSPDYYNTGSSVRTWEAELRYPLADTIEVSGGLGYQLSRNALNHDGLYSNVGIAWFIQPHLTLDLRYHDLHEMHERAYQRYDSYDPYNTDPGNRDPAPAYHLGTPVIFSVSIGL
ncbi:MAG TPA: TorF family putative porin [Halioglobus sp.]